MKKQGIVNSVSQPKEFQGQMQIGFTLKDNPKAWYNVQEEESVLKGLLTEYVKKGAEISFEYNEKTQKLGEITLISVSKEGEKSKGKNPYIVNISGKDFMTYEGLLKKAHEKKENFNMELTESWVSEDMTRAWCKVRLTAEINASVTNLRIFDGFGSSTPENTGKMTESHPVEMAHTRAKGRALRDYLNIGQVMAEELKKE